MKFIKSFFSVLVSNIATLLSGILVGFVLPSVLSIEDYGYYKTFTLYVTYLGLFSLGMIDGIVLKYGGYNYEQLDRKLFRSFFQWYLIIHVLVSFALSGFLLFLKQDYQINILIMLIINMFALNIAGYFRQLSEITQRFKEYSIIKVVQSVLAILSVVIVAILVRRFHVNVNYIWYMIVVVICNTIIAVWYVMLYKELVFGKSIGLKQTSYDVRMLMHNGIPLMLANLCSTLILTIDRQFVNVLFDNRTYAIYAFAYNILSMLTIATSAVSTVLYPTLKRTSEDDTKDRFPVLVSSSLILLYSVLILFFPLAEIIRIALPKYLDSISIFRVIFPGLPITSTITVIIHNYYKMRGESATYFKQSLIILALSAIANGIAYYCFGTTVSISFASVIVIFAWFFYVGIDISNKLQASILKDFSFAIISTLVFYVFSSFSHWAIGMFGYLICFSLIVFLLKRDVVNKLGMILKNKMKGETD